jgi:hypothetical protein
MKNYFLFILIGIVLTGLFFTSCDPVGPQPTDNVVEVTTDITTPTVWAGNKVYVIKKYDFYVEDQLTIEAGAVIKFTNEAKFLTISGNGKILANGTAESPITFTSFFDDSNGGDSNDDATATTATVGNWGNIDLNGTTSSVFTYCKFLYGGYGTAASSTLNLSGESKADIVNCTFANNGGGKSGNYYIGVLHADNASSETVIRNNKFYNNVLPITINAEINIDNSNTFSSGASKNTYNAIYVSRNVEKNTSWLEDEVAFVITSDNMSVGIGDTLTLGDNVILKFVAGSTLTLLSGESALQNYNGAGVFYTSFKDDELLGDSNGDSSASSPASADWTGIFIDIWKSAGYAQWANIKYNDPNPPSKK